MNFLKVHSEHMVSLSISSLATSELGCLKVYLPCLNTTDSHGVLSCLQNPLCHMSTILDG